MSVEQILWFRSWKGGISLVEWRRRTHSNDDKTAMSLPQSWSSAQLRIAKWIPSFLEMSWKPIAKCYNQVNPYYPFLFQLSTLRTGKITVPDQKASEWLRWMRRIETQWNIRQGDKTWWCDSGRMGLTEIEVEAAEVICSLLLCKMILFLWLLSYKTLIYRIFSCKGRNFKTSFGGPNSGFAHYMRHTFGMMKIFIFSTSVVLLVVVRNLEFCILFINRVVVWKDWLKI